MTQPHHLVEMKTAILKIMKEINLMILQHRNMQLVQGHSHIMYSQVRIVMQSRLIVNLTNYFLIVIL
jgi:hypothetical protein